MPTRNDEIEDWWGNLRSDVGHYRYRPTDDVTKHFKDNLTTPVVNNADVAYARGEVISNGTEFVPVVLFQPPNYYGSIREELLKKSHSMSLPDFSNLRNRNRRLARRFMSYASARTKLSYYAIRDNSFIGLSNFTAFHFSSQGTKILWIAVVPFENSSRFHYDYLNWKPILPWNYGMEMWYSPDTLASLRNPTITKFFRDRIIGQMEDYGVIGRSKTLAEMKTLFIEPRSEEKFKTIKSQKLHGVSKIQSTLTLMDLQSNY